MRGAAGAGALGLALAACALPNGSVRLLPEYRSEEIYGVARWGMAHEELRSAIGDLVACGEHLLCRDESMRGRLAHVTYGLPRGQLAYVAMQFESPTPAADFEALRAELAQVYGTPLAPTDAEQVVQNLAAVASALLGRDIGALGLPLAWGRALWKTKESEVLLVSPNAPSPALRLILSSRILRP